MKSALLIIDVQNEYFASAGGKFDQFNVDELGQKIADYAQTAQQNGELVIGVQHLMADDYPLFAKAQRVQKSIPRWQGFWRINRWYKKPTPTVF